jgi:CRP-like cAMP-binding protein
MSEPKAPLGTPTAPRTSSGGLQTSRGFVSTLDLFKSIPPSQMSWLEKRLTEKRYPKGQPIFLEGDSATHVWFVKEGRVKAVKHMPQGRDLTICTLGQNHMFGTCCSFSAEHYPCNALAETDTVVVSLSMADFVDLMKKYPDVSRELVSHLSTRLRRMQDMRTFDQESVEKRILHVLVHLVGEFGNHIPLTRREVAEMAGTTVETCIRTFKTLEEEGLVETSRGLIVVKELQNLIDRQEEIG